MAKRAAEQADLIIVVVPDRVRISLLEGRNWTLQKFRVIGEGKRRGQVEWQSIGYYPNLEQCADSLLGKWIDLLAGTSGEKRVYELLATIRIAGTHLQEVTAGALAVENKELRRRVAQLEQQLAEAQKQLAEVKGE